MLSGLPQVFRPPKPARQIYDGPDVFLQTGLIHHWYAGLARPGDVFQDLKGGCDIQLRRTAPSKLVEGAGWLVCGKSGADQDWSASISEDGVDCNQDLTITLFYMVDSAVQWPPKIIFALGDTMSKNYIIITFTAWSFQVAICCGDYYYEATCSHPDFDSGSVAFPYGQDPWEGKTALIIDRSATAITLVHNGNTYKLHTAVVDDLSPIFPFNLAPRIIHQFPLAVNKFGIAIQEIRIYNSALSGQDLIDSLVKTMVPVPWGE